MDIQTSFRTCRSKYATFSGRASRSEFWWFQLIAFVMVQFLIPAISKLFGSISPGHASDNIDIIQFFFSIILLSPTLAVGSRRLHDVGRSGWWQLLTFTIVGILVLTYWWVQPSQPGPNQYGEEPETDKGTAPASPIPPAAHSQPAPQSAPVIHSEPASVPPTVTREAPKGMMDWAKSPPVPGSEPQAKRKEQSTSKGMPLILIFIIAFAAFVVAYYAQNNGGALKDIFSRLQSTVSSVTTGAVASGGGSGFQFSSEKDKMTNERVYVGYQNSRNRDGLQLQAVFKCMTKSEIINDVVAMATFCGANGNTFLCPDHAIRNMTLNATLFDKSNDPVQFQRNDTSVSYERKMTPTGAIEQKFTELERAGDRFYNNAISVRVPAYFDDSDKPDFAADAADDDSEGIIYRFNAFGMPNAIDLNISFKDRQFAEMTKACNKNMPTLAEIKARLVVQQGQR